MFSLALTVQLEYINHLLQFFKNISYYAGIMLNAFSDLLCSKLCWHNRLVPNYNTYILYQFIHYFILGILVEGIKHGEDAVKHYQNYQTVIVLANQDYQLLNENSEVVI